MQQNDLDKIFYTQLVIARNKQVFSLFKPEPRLSTALKERMRHFKRYPDDIPGEIASKSQ
ncbi:MAG: hypothetical protein J7L71_03525 [Spirochaetaceae bacterium]|nr:hypothetical protein [Spirochaetaceae bacterium]